MFDENEDDDISTYRIPPKKVIKSLQKTGPRNFGQNGSKIMS